MNLEFTVDKDTSFYYWAQSISDWSIVSLKDKANIRHYEALAKPFSVKEQTSLDNVRRTLQSSDEPYLVLAELYTGKITSDEARTIVEASKALANKFEPVWQESLPRIKKWHKALQATDFKKFHSHLQDIADFLSSDIDLDAEKEVKLLHHPKFAGSAGRAIRNSDFMLLHVPGRQEPPNVNSTDATLVHEYVHLIEHQSKTTQQLFKASHQKVIKPTKLEAPAGYSWKAFFTEAIVYCFASTTIGGYLRPQLYQKPIPTVGEMKDGFNRIVKQKRYRPEDVMNWVALNILPDVAEYIKNGKQIDHKITDKMARQYVDFYSQHK